MIRSLLLASLSALALLACTPAIADQAPRAVPMATADMPAPTGAGLQTAVLAGGCFWGLEGVFEHVRGVHSVRSGYSGGRGANPNYEGVSTETTGYAEAVEITYDPRVVTYGQLLRVYFSVATDPTQLNRQGPDSGTSYRSAIFAQNADQSRVAAAYIKQLTAAHAFNRPIVTRVESGKFYTAEAGHQDFMRRNPMHPYILANDVGKVSALKRAMPNLYRG